jgi:xanthine dehydrogenase YagS FAD-binding subunit
LLYELPIIEHVDAKSVEEALSLLRRYGEKARVMAGGTDLLGLMKDRIKGPRLPIPDILVNIKSIPGMDRITKEGERGLRIGAAVTIHDLETSELIKTKYHLLLQATMQVGTAQIRYMGTLGGNICQRPRCLYFRHLDFVCYKKGGERCYALIGEHRYYHAIMKHGKCVMAHPSDLAPALVALRAKAIMATSDGEREIPFQDFFLGPNHFTETVLKSNEFLTAVRVPNHGDGSYQQFLKRRVRSSVDFSLSTVAAVAQISGGLGGVAPFPLEASGAEEVVRGRTIEDRVVSQAAEAAVERARPLPMNRYKTDLTKALVRRVLTSIREEAGKKD